MEKISEREALDLIRATATRSVPNCINLPAIDRILADVITGPGAGITGVLNYRRARIQVLEAEVAQLQAALLSKVLDALAAPAPVVAPATGVVGEAGLMMSAETVRMLRADAAGLLSEEQWKELQVEGDVHDGAVQGRAYLATQLLAAALTTPAAPGPGAAAGTGGALGAWVGVSERLPASFDVVPTAFIDTQSNQVLPYGNSYYNSFLREWMDDDAITPGNPTRCHRKIAYWLDRGPMPALPAPPTTGAAAPATPATGAAPLPAAPQPTPL